MSGANHPLSGRAATGVEGLDEILDGGFPRDRLYLVEGDPGAGKTTLALQFLLEGVRQGEPGLYVTLSETDAELRAVADSHGWSLDDLRICDLAASEESLRAEAQYTLFHPAEVELGETTRMVLEEVEQVQPMRVCFDSLSEMRLLARDPLRYRRQILALKQYFTGRQCTVLLLDDRSSSVGDIQVASLAHGVLSLEQHAPDYGRERRRLQVIKLRGSRFHGGYHDFQIITGGIMVYPRLVAAQHGQETVAEELSSQVRELDALVGGGLRRGTSTLILGAAGTGKSTLAAHYAVAAASQGERAVLYLFDEGPGTLLARAESLGMGLRQEVEAGRIMLRQVDPAELTPGEFAYLVRQSVERDNARVVVIDSLSGYMSAMLEERFLSLHLHELLSYLNQQGVVSLLVLAQHGLPGVIPESAIDVSYITDSVLLLRYFEAAGEVRRAISMVKKRSGSHERAIRELSLGSEGIRVGEPLREFQGVLTGQPTYLGPTSPLLDRKHGRDER